MRLLTYQESNDPHSQNITTFFSRNNSRKEAEGGSQREGETFTFTLHKLKFWWTVPWRSESRRVQPGARTVQPLSPAQRRHITAGTETPPSDPTCRDGESGPCGLQRSCTGRTAAFRCHRRDAPASIFSSSREEMTGARSSQASVRANRLARIRAWQRRKWSD